MSRLKIGVVGAGAWGRNHVRIVAGLADAELAAVCDTDAAARQRIARQHPGALVTGDIADLLGGGAVRGRRHRRLTGDNTRIAGVTVHRGGQAVSH